MNGGMGLDWDSADVQAFRASLPPHQRLCALTELSDAARANLRQCFIDSGDVLSAESVDVPAPADIALADMKLIVQELDYLPPLCPPEDVERLRYQLLQVAPRRVQHCHLASDPSGGVMSPGPQAIRSIMTDTSGDLDVASRTFRLLTSITRKPVGSAAPGSADGPPARITLRDLHPGTPSTLGEPMHVDGKPAVSSSRAASTRLDRME